MDQEKCDGARFDMLCYEFRSFLGPGTIPRSRFGISTWPSMQRLQKLLKRCAGWNRRALRCQFRQLERLQ